MSWRDSRKDVGSIFILAFLVLFFFKGFLLSPDNLILSHYLGDARRLVLPTRALGFQEILRGTFPLWNPYILGGLPYLGETHTSFFFPLNWFFFLLFPLAKGLSYIVLFEIFLAGCFQFLYLRVIGLGRFGSLFGSIGFMFSSVFIHRVYAGHHVVIAVLSLLPALFWIFEMNVVSEDSRIKGWGAVLFALMIFAGYPQQVALLTIAFFVYALCRSLIPWNPGILRKSGVFLAFMIVMGTCLSAVQLFPTLDFGMQSFRASFSQESRAAFSESFSLPPENLLTFLFPRFFGDTIGIAYWGRWLFWEMCPYVGVLTLLMACFAFFSERRSLTFSAGISCGITLLLALGSYLPTFSLLKQLPLFTMFRGYSKFSSLTCFFLTVLAGIGVDHFFSRPENDASRRMSKFVFGVSFLGLLFILCSPYLATRLISAWQTLLSGYFALIHRPAFSLSSDSFLQDSYAVAMGSFSFACLFLCFAAITLLAVTKGYIGKNAGKVCLALLLFFDLFGTGKDLANFSFPAEASGFGRDVREFLKADPDRFRIATSFTPFENDSMLERFENISGYETLIWKRYLEFLNFSQGNLGDPVDIAAIKLRPSSLLELLNVKYWLFPFNEKPESSTMKLVFRGDSYNIFLNPGFLPRFSLVPLGIFFTDPRQVLPYIASPSFNPRFEVALEGDATDTAPRNGTHRQSAKPGPTADFPAANGPMNAVTASGSICQTGWSLNRRTVCVSLENPAWLLVSEMNIPGWNAQDNGVLTPIFTANYLFQAIWLEKGPHEIVFSYEPRSFRYGLFLSIATFLALTFFLAKNRPSRSIDR